MDVDGLALQTSLRAQTRNWILARQAMGGSQKAARLQPDLP